MMKIGSAQKSCYCNQKELSTYTTSTIANVMKCGGTTMKRLLKIIFKTLWSNHLSMRSLRLLATVLLVIFCCGCCFTDRASDICNKYHEDITILERNSELSKDMTTFTVHTRKWIEYGRNRSKGEVKETTHAYSLTTPERNGKLCQWTLVPSLNAERVKVDNWCIKPPDIHNKNYKKSNTVDYNNLALPTLDLPYYSKKSIIQIHPNDISFLSKPVIISHKNEYILAIPYQFENNICHLYIPKENLVSESRFTETSDMLYILLTTTLIPPAVILDVITSPIQFIVFVHNTLNGKSHLKIYPYP